MRRTLLTLVLVLTAPLCAAAPSGPVRPVEQFADQTALTNHFKALGHHARGGIDKAESDRDAGRAGSFPHFTSSFTTGGVTYPFTMIGYPPKSGRASAIKSVIIPLRMHFDLFGPNQDISHTFEPGPAVLNMIRSPMYDPAPFPGIGTGQFGDQLQRAAFWNRMDPGHRWHVRMAAPAVAPTIDIEVTPALGTLSTDTAGNMFGDVLIDFMDAEARTIIQLLELGADTLPIFVTDNVTAQALGYHNAYSVPDGAGGTRLQTFIYTSWFDPALVDPLFADVSTFNHELGEWLNDPFVNNIVPTWKYPPPSDPRGTCSGNPFLEVGDPQGNGPTFDDFPTIGVTLDGVTYHLQQLVLWQWFADEVPSSALNGWYTFPSPSSLAVPAVYCP